MTGGATPQEVAGPAELPALSGPPGAIWTRAFAVSCAVSLLVSLVFILLMVTMAGYATEEFGSSAALAGFAASSFVVGALLARPMAGRYLDVVGKRRLLIASLALSTLACTLYLVAGSLGSVLAVRLVHGVGFGVAHTTVAASVLTMVPLARRAEGVGYYTMSSTLGTAIAPMVAVAAAEIGGQRAVFGVAAALSALALVGGVMLHPPVPYRPHPGSSAPDTAAPRLVERSALPMATVILLVGVAISGLMAFAVSHAAAQGLEQVGAAFFVVYSTTILLSRVVAGRVHDARGDNAIVYPALGALASGLVVLAVAHSAVPFVLAAVLTGLGAGTLVASGQVVAVAGSPGHRLGAATSTYFFMLDTGVGLGPLLLGALIGLAGYGAMYAALAGLMAGAAVLYHLVHGRVARRPTRRAPG